MSKTELTMNTEAIVTSKDGIQFRVLLYARTDEQLNAAIRAEQKFASGLTADQLTGCPIMRIHYE
jgi:hypothetical protein